MRKSILTFLSVIGVVALMVPGIAMSANYDLKKDDMKAGDDYTRTWQAGHYSAWDSNGPSTSAGAMWGGWDWAAQFIAPCPQWLKIPDAYGGKCNWDAKVNTDYSMSAEAQTKWGLDGEVDGTIVDDLYGRVVDHWRGAGVDKGVLDQDLDILFGRHSDLVGKEKHVIYEGYDAHTTDTYIDQAIDQQLAFWEDMDLDSVVDVNTENGLTQRLVNDFAIALLSTYNSPTDSVVVDKIHLQEGFKVDQWVVQWLRDIDAKSTTYNRGKEGIDQLYSSWFKDDESPDFSGLSSSWNYDLGHTTINKSVTKKDNHDHDPNGGDTYKATGTGGTAWDP